MPETISWAERLEQTEIAAVIRNELWLYPGIEIVHILGFVMLVGTAVMFDLRLLGLSKDISVVKLSNHLLPWSRRSLLLIIPSGFLLFMTNAVSLSNDKIFWIKLSLIALAGINALIFHQTTFRSVSNWERHKPSPIPAKLNATASILLWISVICCGRLLAY